MSHAGHSVAIGSMSMGGLPPLAYFPQYYWAVVGTVIVIATVVNVYNHLLYRQRLSATRAGQLQAAKPKSWFAQYNATTFAIMREASSFSIRIPIGNRILNLPTTGRTMLVLANAVLLMVLCFYGFDLNDRWIRETIGYRTGFVTIGQLPLIFLLAGKNNLIGFLTGISYERLNWIHRWCARCMLLTATIHMGYFFADWAPFDYIGTQLKENTLVWKGVVAWSMLVWIVFSSMTPIRGWCYELFVLQHLVSFAVMVGLIYIHTPVEVHIYIWFPVGFFWFDRVVRVLRLWYANLSLFHPKQRQNGRMTGLWACKAEFIPLVHNTTRVVFHNPPIHWAPGQHVFLSCHSTLPLQSHPFTIASIPEDGRMEFVVKAETGGTRRFFRHAEKTHGLPVSDPSCAKAVNVEGPYGCHRPLRQFDSVVLLAGSTGATFTVPMLRDILQGWIDMADLSPKASPYFVGQPRGAATRHVRFVWVVRSRGQLEWFSEQLSSVYSRFTSLQERLGYIKLEITVYVTCDETFTEEHKTLLSALAAPNRGIATKGQQSMQYGVVHVHNTPSLASETKAYGQYEEIKEMRVESLSSTVEALACGPEGTCCCKATVDETCPDTIQPACHYRTEEIPKESVQSRSQLSSAPTSAQQKPLLHLSITVYSGRPNPKDIIRRTLEQAMGESAVVVCGPQGLVSDVKQHVCSLSDERAVHKGTGAQGIYLHTESFGY